MTFTIGSFLLALALLIVLALFLARPFFDPAYRKRETDDALSHRDVLLKQKETLLESIRALDFEYETGKVPAEVYELQRSDLVAQTATVLHALDEMETPEADAEVIADIEAAVRDLRRKRPAAKVTTQFCPQCGQPVDSNDHFCASCGHQLQSLQVEIAS